MQIKYQQTGNEICKILAEGYKDIANIWGKPSSIFKEIKKPIESKPTADDERKLQPLIVEFLNSYERP